LITVIGLRNLPAIKKGDDVGKEIVQCASRQGEDLREEDVVVIAQKIVSKSEGRVVDLKEINPSDFAREVAQQTRRSPRHVEVILRETSRMVRMQKSHLITQTKHGFICANAGVDRSNVPGKSHVILLPEDPDRSALRIRDRIYELTKRKVAAIISDTFGRPWRLGYVNVAIGVAGMKPLKDYRGIKDMYNRTLNVTMMAVADELASTAELVMNKTDRIPVAIIRGYSYPKGDGSAKDLIRPPELDMFS
jgi:coenzyme F420-0:L-glutamate ligase/coenzyme F420-1:gamma-L-glutamate ligase